MNPEKPIHIINVPLETLRPDPLSPGNFLDPDVLTVSLVWLREILVEDQNFRIVQHRLRQPQSLQHAF